VLRHNCGYKLANDGYDTRAIQHASTVRYAALAPDRFKRGSGKTRGLALAEIGGVFAYSKKAPEVVRGSVGIWVSTTPDYTAGANAVTRAQQSGKISGETMKATYNASAFVR
jgi:hypothetical protein